MAYWQVDKHRKKVYNYSLSIQYFKEERGVEMICKIADLTVDVPESGNMGDRCKDYITNAACSPDITVLADQYRPDRYQNANEETVCYMESGFQFYRELLKYNGIMLHSSAVTYEGRAYLFSGPCGMGKSTHTRLWQKVFGDKAVVFNDDKPAIRKLDGVYYAYGTPWCGKDGINANMKLPLAGICFLKRGEQNTIRRLNGFEAATNSMAQTLHRFKDESNLSLMLAFVDELINSIPVFEFKNLPVPDAAHLSYQTMCQAAKEVGL